MKPAYRYVLDSVAKVIPGLRKTDGNPDALAYIKLFDPCGRWTAYLTEYDPATREAFGFVVSPLGPDCDELGYVSLSEIEATTNRLGLHMERDIHWKPTPLSQVQSGAAR